MSSPMIAWLPVVNRIHKYLTASNNAGQFIDLPSVKTYDIETAPEKTPRTLKHLIRANHVNHAVLYHNLQYHNHMPHILGSAYLLGADHEHLQKIYDREVEELEEWKASPAEITDADWRDFLGNKMYQRAFVDFFEDELALKFDYHWKEVVEQYMFCGKEPLINGVIGGLGHPLIHLGYAYELSNKELAMEALTLASTSYNFLHKYLDNPSYTTPSTYTTNTPLEIFQKIHLDTRLDNLFSSPGPGNLEGLFGQHEAIVLEHWNAWTIDEPMQQFKESQEAAIALLTRTVAGTAAYDFFMVHILTTSHAVRILIPLIPKKFHVALVRQWFLLAIAVYITQLRPKISEHVEKKPSKSWASVEQKAIDGPWSTDAHYVKAIRAIREAALTWGDAHEYCLSAAIDFADSFNGWTGFGLVEERVSF